MGERMSQSLVIASIGTKLVKGLLSIWLGDKGIAKLTAELGLDFFEKYTTDFYEARRAKRFFEELADRVSGDLSSFIESEHKELPKGDAKQFMESSLEVISSPEFYDLCITERLSFERILKSAKPLLERQATQRAIRSSVLESIFQFILMEFVTVLSSLPQFNRVAFRKILEDTEVIIEKISRLQAKLDDLASPVDDESIQQEHIYRRNFARKFRKIQLFGVDSRGLEKKYDLSIGYISLTISNDEIPTGGAIEDILSSGQVAEARFSLITGAPGSGKTTILSWLALNCADRSLQNGLAALNSLIPVFFAFREYADQELPKGKAILTTQVGALSDTLDPKWVRQQLKRGRFLFLLDGFDEVNEQRRERVATWIVDLGESFPESKFFVTSRPYAIHDIEDEDFPIAELHVEPMDSVQITKFVDHWYGAYSHDADDRQQLERLRASRERLQEALASSFSLRSISSNPLLCALICFVNADREGFVPTARGDLYNIAAETLLERREKERRITSFPDLALSKQHKFKIVGFVAEYFFKRRSTQLQQESVAEHLKEFLPALGLDPAKSDEILKFLVERSQILRSPDEGSVDFSHKTFQEYFYARRVVDSNLREAVAEDFFLRESAEVVLFVSALAPSEFVEYVVRKAISQLDETRKSEFRDRVIFLNSCVTETAEMNVELRKIVAEKLDGVLPPKTSEEAEGLGSAGRSIIEPLSKFATLRHKRNWQHCVTALVATMTEEAFPALSMFAKLGDKSVDGILLNGKRFFESTSYNNLVLAHCAHIKKLVVRDSFDFDLMITLNGLVDIEMNAYEDGFDRLVTKESVVSLKLEYVRSLKSLDILTNFPKLRKLEIVDSSYIEDFSGIGRCKELRELRIESDSAVVDLGFLVGLNELRTVDVSECSALVDVRAIDQLLKISDVSLPFVSLYAQLNPRLQKAFELLDQDYFDD
jgi:energy-coupling factor transporter ATP-binding protein EcfA2